MPKSVKSEINVSVCQLHFLLRSKQDKPIQCTGQISPKTSYTLNPYTLIPFTTQLFHLPLSLGRCIFMPLS